MVERYNSEEFPDAFLQLYNSEEFSSFPFPLSGGGIIHVPSGSHDFVGGH